MNLRLRFFVTLAVFVAWLGFLGYLVAITRDAVLLSRPQFLPANVYVLAQLTGADSPDEKVTITEVSWAADGEVKERVGKQIDVKPLGVLNSNHGWRGPGVYILALMQMSKDAYHLTPTPPSPGYGPPLIDRYKIYPLTPGSRQQLDEIVAKKR